MIYEKPNFKYITEENNSFMSLARGICIWLMSIIILKLV